MNMTHLFGCVQCYEGCDLMMWVSVAAVAVCGGGAGSSVVAATTTAAGVPNTPVAPDKKPQSTSTSKCLQKPPQKTDVAIWLA